MEQLTDKVIVETIGQNDIMGFVMALVVILFLGFFCICSLLYWQK